MEVKTITHKEYGDIWEHLRICLDYIENEQKQNHPNSEIRRLLEKQVGDIKYLLNMLDNKPVVDL